MAISSGMFMSVNGDRKYQASWFAKYFASFIGNGVFPNPSTGLQVLDNGTMTIKVKPGDAWINGYYMTNDGDYIIQHDVADGLLNRIDRIVVRWSLDTRSIEIKIKKGTGATSAKAPTLQRNADVYELALADVSIPKGLTTVTQAQITDHRLNTDLCGIVSGVVKQVDTTTIFNQYQSWFAQQEVIYEASMTGWTAAKRAEYETFQTDRKAEFDTFQSARETSFNQWQTKEKADFDIWFNALKDLVKGDVVLNLQSQLTALTKSVNDHKAVQAHTSAVHGMRVTDGVFEFFNGTEWTPVKGGGGGVAPRTIYDKSIIWGNRTASLTWKEMVNTVVLDVEGVRVNLATLAGVRIRRSDVMMPKTEKDGVLVYDSEEHNKHATVPFVDTGLTNGVRYFYKAFPYSTDGVVGFDNENSFRNGVPMDMDDVSGSPGPNKLAFGNMNAGFFGEVPVSQMWTNEKISSDLGIGNGKVGSNTAWLKLASMGSVIFVPKLAVRSQVSPSLLNDAGLRKHWSKSTKILTKGSVSYHVGLLNGAKTDPPTGSFPAHGSEYNKIIIPLIDRAITKDYYVPSNVESTMTPWKHGLGTGIQGLYTAYEAMGQGGGSDMHTANGTLWEAVTRSVSKYNTIAAHDTHLSLGWFPVLRVIQ